MALYQYKGRNESGELIQGQREADSTDVLAGQLFDASITPVSIEEIKVSEDFMDSLSKKLGLGKPTSDDIILFTRQMYALTKSGVPIIRGLTLIASSAKNKLLSECLYDIIDDLESGQTLSGALSHHAHIFSPLYINIVRVGEETGNLDGA